MQAMSCTIQESSKAGVSEAHSTVIRPTRRGTSRTLAFADESVDHALARLGRRPPLTRRVPLIRTSKPGGIVHLP
jgi:hypothetical protein